MTRTITQRQSGWIIAVLCAICLIGGFALATAPVHAAGGTINVTYSDAQGNFDTTLKVYKVGHFENGNDLVWDKAFSGLDLPDVSEKNFSGDDKMKEWADALRNAGYTLQGALEAETDPITIQGYPLDCSISKSTGTGSVSVTENGLYLIIGPREAVTAAGVTTGYTPIPGFVTVFSGRTNPQIAIKSVQDHAKNYQVFKDWDAADKDKPREELLRPDGIQVKIYYREGSAGTWTEATDLNDGKDIILNEENNWAFNWKSDNLNLEWKTEEIMPEDAAAYYQESRSEDIHDNYIRFTHKNTFKQYQLKLTKIIDEFVKHNDNVATDIIFRVDGYKGGEVVYSVPAAISFTTAGSNDTIIDNIPLNLDKIVVTEVYTANYTPKGPTEATVTTPNNQGVYEVSFDNGWSKTVNYDSGIINKYGLTNQTDLGDGYEILERIGLRGKDVN